MKPNNTKELLAQPDIGSRLIGRASLKATDLAGIIAVSKYNCIPCFGLAQCAYYLFDLEDKSEMRE